MEKVRIINKSISFNVKDENQRKLHEHAKTKSNFSAYIKHLIQSDMILNQNDNELSWYDLINAVYRRGYSPTDIMTLIQEFEYSGYDSSTSQ